MSNGRSAFKEATPLVSCTSHGGGVLTASSFLLAAVLLGPISSAQAEYRLHAGDIIEISVARFPELKQRVSVQMDGTISYPLLGTLSVADLSPATAQAKVQALLAAKAFRQRTPDGREYSVGIDPDEVTATVVEYRPIYVNGDIAKPGELAYRPQMTIRQAIALSGGYDTSHLRMNNPILETADLRGEYESLWTEYAKEQAHVWRLKVELGQETTLEKKALLDVPIERPTAQAIVNVETEALKSRQADERAERAYLQQGIAKADEQIQFLSEQLKTEDLGTQEDTKEFERAKELLSRGTVTSTRVTDARRALLLSSTRTLQTSAQLMFTRRQRDELSRQIEKLDGQRRADLLRELQDANLALNKIRFKLQSTGEKLQYTTLAKTQLVRGFGKKPAITVVRNGTKKVEHLDVNEEFELEPGDVVEVAFQNEVAPENANAGVVREGAVPY
jgi:polysaccharide export outer membrane protein